MAKLPKPTLAILGGTGKEGPGLAMRWALAGYPIIIGSRQAEKARRVAAELNGKLGIHSITGMPNGEAARSADISVLTVVYSAHRSAVESLKAPLQGKILVDATARVDFRDPHPPLPPSAARQAQDILGAETSVVAAFQNVPAHVLKKLDQPLQTDVLVCADDPGAARRVIALSEAIGMRGLYAGDLDHANVVEGLVAMLISINKYYKTRAASFHITGLSMPEGPENIRN